MTLKTIRRIIPPVYIMEHTEEPKLHVFDIQRFSVHDGPGIRTTVFLKGCPLRCAWCQNPESQNAYPQLMLYPALCLACGICMQVCPEFHNESMWQTDQSQMFCGDDSIYKPDTCQLCGSCVDVCPTGARRIAGQVLTLKKVQEEILRDRFFYGDDGGVTFSGGEPLAQWDVLRPLILKLHKLSIHVAIDTAGIAPKSVLNEVPDYIDLVLVDLKLVTNELHSHWTGVGNQELLKTISKWNSAMPGRLWISVPVIPGVQDEAELIKLADYICHLFPIPLVRLIPYHKLGESKYQALGKSVPQFPAPSDELISMAKTIFTDRCISIMELGD